MSGFPSLPLGLGLLLTVVGSQLSGHLSRLPTGHTPTPSGSSTTMHTLGATSESPVPPTPHGTCTPSSCCINCYCMEVSRRFKSK